MLARDPDSSRHPLDDATQVTVHDGRLSGRTSDAYFAFVGPFGGVTAATMLNGVLGHPERAGDPLALTVNFCAPIARGAFDLAVRLIKANRSSQHWSMELSQDGSGVAAFATAVLAERRPSWSHAPTTFPDVTPFADTPVFPDSVAAPWVKQFEFRFAEGNPTFAATAHEVPGSPHSKLWISDRSPRRVDMLALASMADAFFGRIFHVRGAMVPFGTVSMTTYFHVDAADLATEDTTTVLGVADGNIFHKNYADQTAELWSPSGRLLATSHQVAYFKA